MEIVFVLVSPPEPMRASIHRLLAVGEKTAGTSILLDNRFRNEPVEKLSIRP